MNEGGSRNIKQHQGFYDVILNQKLDFITKGLSLKASLSYTTSSSWTTQIMPGKILGKDDLVAQRTHIRMNRVYDYANPIYNADGTITYNYTEKRYPDENAPEICLLVVFMTDSRLTDVNFITNYIEL